MPLLTESFDTANSTTLGPNLAWVEALGNWEVSGNAAVKSAAVGGPYGWCYATTSVGGVDHFAEATVTVVRTSTAGTYFERAGVAVRIDTSTGNHYSAGLSKREGGTADDAYKVSKYVGGVLTDIATTPSAAEETATIRLEVEGSTLRMYVGGVLKITTTDTDITTGTNVGIAGGRRSSSQIWSIDTFSANTLGVAGPNSGVMAGGAWLFAGVGPVGDAPDVGASGGTPAGGTWSYSGGAPVGSSPNRGTPLPANLDIYTDEYPDGASWHWQGSEVAGTTPEITTRTGDPAGGTWSYEGSGVVGTAPVVDSAGGSPAGGTWGYVGTVTGSSSRTGAPAGGVWSFAGEASGSTTRTGSPAGGEWSYADEPVAGSTTSLGQPAGGEWSWLGYAAGAADPIPDNAGLVLEPLIRTPALTVASNVRTPGLSQLALAGTGITALPLAPTGLSSPHEES